jgi:agmatinase
MDFIDQLESPTFAQICSFARLPHSKNLENLDVAFLGIPFDDGTTFRPGARFGPRAVREASCQMIKPFNYALNSSPLNDLTIADYGDVDVVPGYIEETFVRIEESVSTIVNSNVFPLCCGGDHSIVLPILRSTSKKYGKLSLIQFDSHTDCGDEYF